MNFVALTSVDHSSPAFSDWNTDSGASRNMTPHRSWFKMYTPHTVPIRLADDSVIYSAGIGLVVFRPRGCNGEELTPVEFHDVLHVPNLKNNLLSPFYLMREKGYTININNSTVDFIHGGKTRFSADISDHNVGYLRGSTQTFDQKTTMITANSSTTSTCPMNLTLWHRRCAHISSQTVHRMIDKRLVNGIKCQNLTNPDPICESCIAGKLHRHNIPKTPHTPHQIKLSRIYSDLKGPLSVATPEGFRYWITFICDSSRFWAVYPLRQKSDTFKAFKVYKAYAENANPGLRIIELQDDEGGEYIGKEFIDFCQENGIQRRHTETDEPYQNGVAERANRTIMEGCETLLAESKLPGTFWWRAVAAFVHVRNRCPTRTLPDTTPFEKWTGRKPHLSYLRVFGCLAYVLIKKPKRRTLQSHATKCIFVGYASGKKAWNFYNPQTQRFTESSHATFDERVFPGNKKDLINPFRELTPTTKLTPQQLVDNSNKEILSELHHRGGVITYSNSAPPEITIPILHSKPTPSDTIIPTLQEQNPTTTLSEAVPNSPLTPLPELPTSPIPPISPIPPTFSIPPTSPSPSPPSSPPRGRFELKFDKKGLVIAEPNTGRGHRLRNMHQSSSQNEQSEPINDDSIEDEDISAGLSYVVM